MKPVALRDASLIQKTVYNLYRQRYRHENISDEEEHFLITDYYRYCHNLDKSEKPMSFDEFCETQNQYVNFEHFIKTKYTQHNLLKRTILAYSAAFDILLEYYYDLRDNFGIDCYDEICKYNDYAEFINALSRNRDKQSAIKSLTKLAVEQNELHLLFTSKDIYKYAQTDDDDMPFDHEQIIEYINALYRECDNKQDRNNIAKSFSSSIYSLLNGSDEFNIWVAYHICWSQNYDELNNHSAFKIITPELREKLEKSVNDYRYQLSDLKCYVGKKYPDGLYGDIMKLEQSGRPVFLKKE